ncbi:MAG: response regulator transcription factor [Flavobacterium sp.]|nr:response regulator transcription factor [Flavobacterium sp.]
MFKKILVAEDLDAISQTIIMSLDRFKIPIIEHVKYCDDAVIKIHKSLYDNQPYDLLITDLSFKPDHRNTNLKSGRELIEAIKKIHPEIKVIVYSIEDKSYLIKSLFKDLGINAFVIKGRNSILELQEAVEKVYASQEKVLSKDLEYALNNPSVLQIEAFDLEILKQLSKGHTVDEISDCFKSLGIAPNGISSLEKRIGKLKIYFKANNNVHLISISKDLGLM